MSKQKKITIKPFLNKNLQPECSDYDGKVEYPLYIQVTYDRKNTQIRSKYGWFYQDLNDPMLKNLKEFESDILTKIIIYETKGHTKSYDLKGLKDRYDIYGISIRLAMGEFLKEKLKKAILKTNNELMHVLNFKGFKCDFENVYKGAKLLFENLPDCISEEYQEEIFALELFNKVYPDNNAQYNFPTIIDWVNGDLKSIFEQKLNKEVKNRKVVSGTIKIIDRIIKANLKSITKGA